MVLLHPGVWGGPWNTIIPVFWVSVYLFGFVVTGRWAWRQDVAADTGLLGAACVAFVWPLLAVILLAGKVLHWMFT